uniref:Coiled-coil domain-containing protein 137 n=1 Tax=Panagrolaimus superbus TaxID=310955 RepID=A0A914XXR2_9BILA
MAKISGKSFKAKRVNDKPKEEGYVPIRSKKNFKLNKAPKSTDMEEQYVPRRVREIKELQEAMKNPNKRAKLKKNVVLDEARKHGFERRPWEDNRSFTKRIDRETRDSVNLEMLKVRHAMAGRDINEIREDYKQLDEVAKRKKALKIMRKEKLAKLKSKGKISDDHEEKEAEDDEEGEVEEKHKKIKKQVPEKDIKVKKLTKNERIREYKKEAKETEKRELLLNAREVIQFGERVDAPPTFSAKFRKEFDPLFANAGSKDLLLKKMMEKKNVSVPSSTPLIQLPKDSKVSAEERQRVIDMHRALKKAGKQKPV